MHITCEPSILYFGTPVVLISTLNEDGTPNLAPMSSAWWLGWRCMLGLSAVSKTTLNILRTKQCVLNLPSANEVGAVNRIALTTGSDPVPAGKLARGYRTVKDKFALAGLTETKSHSVAPPRVRECPVQMEAVLEGMHAIASDDPLVRGRALALEMRIQRVHVAPHILMEGHENRVDPDKWKPLIMSFQKFYGLGEGQVHESTLGSVPEQLYRSPDVDRARAVAAGYASL